MWLMTPIGFFSLVKVSEREAAERGLPPLGLDAWLAVRARALSHLTRLRQRFPEQLREAQIIELQGRDYPWRLFVRRRIMAAIAVELVSDIHYENFKGEAERVHGHHSPYVDMLHAVWGLGRTLESREGAAKPTIGRQLDLPGARRRRQRGGPR